MCAANTGLTDPGSSSSRCRSVRIASRPGLLRPPGLAGGLTEEGVAADARHQVSRGLVDRGTHRVDHPPQLGRQDRVARDPVTHHDPVAPQGKGGTRRVTVEDVQLEQRCLGVRHVHDNLAEHLDHRDVVPAPARTRRTPHRRWARRRPRPCWERHRSPRPRSRRRPPPARPDRRGRPRPGILLGLRTRLGSPQADERRVHDASHLAQHPHDRDREPLGVVGLEPAQVVVLVVAEPDVVQRSTSSSSSS